MTIRQLAAFTLPLALLMSAARADEPAAAPVATPPAASTAAPTAAPAVQRFGICDVYKVAEKLTKGPRFQAEVESKRKEIEAKLAPVIDELKKMEQALRDTKEDARKGAEWEQAVDAFRKKDAEAQQLDQQARAEMVNFVTEKNFEVYKLVLASVDAVATKRGFTHVFNSRSIEDMEKPTSPQGFTQGMLSRSLIKFPASDDITLDVMKDLKLD